MDFRKNKKSGLIQTEQENLFHNVPQLDIFYHSEPKKTRTYRISQYAQYTFGALYSLFFLVSLFNPYMVFSDLMELTSFVLAGVMSVKSLHHLLTSQTNPVKELALKGINKALFYGISSVSFAISGVLLSL